MLGPFNVPIIRTTCAADLELDVNWIDEMAASSMFHTRYCAKPSISNASMYGIVDDLMHMVESISIPFVDRE